MQWSEKLSKQTALTCPKKLQILEISLSFLTKFKADSHTLWCVIFFSKIESSLLHRHLASFVKCLKISLHNNS